MKKVLSIAYNELTNDNRVFNEASSLQESGYDVTVIGYKINPNLPSKEMWNGVTIRRVNIEHRHPMWKRIPYSRNIYNYLNLFIQYVWLGLKCDFIHCHDLNTLQYGVAVKRLKGNQVKLIYDAHEYETERNGLTGKEKEEAKKKEKRLIGFVDKVITVSPTIADEYVRLYGIDRPVIVLNCPVLRTSEIVTNDLFRQKFDISPEKKIFIYQGYLYPGRGIEIIMKAFTSLQMDDCVLVFLGQGPLENTIRNNSDYGKAVFIHPFVGGEVLLEYTSSADYGIAFIEDISLSDRYCLPNKLFEYIAAGLPVICSGLPDLKNFILTHQVGVVAPTNDVEGFIESFKTMRRTEIGSYQTGIVETRKKYNWSTQKAKLIALYREVSKGA
jgi:glycosyltransferase involved in cell wall biosynthesis